MGGLKFKGVEEVGYDVYTAYNSNSSIIGIDPWSNSASIDNYDSEDANYKW